MSAPTLHRDPILISRRQQFVVPAITYQRRIVQSRRGTNTVAVSRLHDCVVGVAGVPVRSRSRHPFIPTQEVAVRTLPQDAVDPGLRVQASYAVRPDPLVRNDLVRTTRPRHTHREEAKAGFEAPTLAAGTPSLSFERCERTSRALLARGRSRTIVVECCRKNGLDAAKAKSRWFRFTRLPAKLLELSATCNSIRTEVFGTARFRPSIG